MGNAMSNTSGVPITQTSDLSEGMAVRRRLPGGGGEVNLREVRQDRSLASPILTFGRDREVRARRVGLIFPDTLSFDAWRQIGSQIFLVADSSAWWVGDWLAHGEVTFGDRYSQAIANTSLDYQTLRNYAWVARKFPISRRRDKLSFGHHAEVAALTDDGQDMWLARAERLSWSRNELRRRLRAAQLANRSLPSRGPQTKELKIDVSVERHECWRVAAERVNCDIADWIIGTLDRAAL